MKGEISISSGELKTRVYTSRAILPIKNALVGITIDGKLVAFRITDENGLTKTIVLTTPEELLSQEPGPERPYSVVSIKIAHPGYQTVEIKDVQIFPGIITLQEVAMVPLEEFPLLSMESIEYYTLFQNL